jgi:hypothetical protein
MRRFDDSSEVIMSLEEEAKAMWEKQVSKGTPKNLFQSIINGLQDTSADDTDPQMAGEIEKHVKDFLAQKFQLFMNGSGDAVDTCAQAIWEKVMGIK